VDLDDEVPVGILHVLEARVAEDACVVDEDVDAAKGLDGRVDDALAELDAVVVGDGLAARGFDLVDDNIGRLGKRWSAWRRGNGENGRGKLTFVELPSPWNEPPRSLTTTLAPRDPKKVAYALPRPPPAPVTTTTCPSYLNCAAMVTYAL
jgi:hypothetical protein